VAVVSMTVEDKLQFPGNIAVVSLYIIHVIYDFFSEGHFIGEAVRSKSTGFNGRF